MGEVGADREGVPGGVVVVVDEGERGGIGRAVGLDGGGDGGEGVDFGVVGADNGVGDGVLEFEGQPGSVEFFVLAELDAAAAFGDLAVELVEGQEGDAGADDLGAAGEAAAAEVGFGDEGGGDVVEGDLVGGGVGGGDGLALCHCDLHSCVECPAVLIGLTGHVLMPPMTQAHSAAPRQALCAGAPLAPVVVDDGMIPWRHSSPVPAPASCSCSIPTIWSADHGRVRIGASPGAFPVEASHDPSTRLRGSRQSRGENDPWFSAFLERVHSQPRERHVE